MTIMSSIVKVFIKPGQVFSKCKENELNWIFPLILIILVYCIGSYLLVPTLIIPDHLSKLDSTNQLNQEEMDAALNYFNSSYHFFSTFLSTAFSKVIYYPVLSFFLTILPLMFGGKAVKYFNMFSAVAYTGIINCIGFLIDTFIKLKYLSLNVGLNLALFFKSSNLFINSLLAKINVFDLWQLVLLTILLSIYYNYSKRKSFIIIFNFWAIIKLISAYFAYLKVLI